MKDDQMSCSTIYSHAIKVMTNPITKPKNSFFKVAVCVKNVPVKQVVKVSFAKYSVPCQICIMAY